MPYIGENIEILQRSVPLSSLLQLAVFRVVSIHADGTVSEGNMSLVSVPPCTIWSLQRPRGRLGNRPFNIDTDLFTKPEAWIDHSY